MNTGWINFVFSFLLVWFCCNPNPCFATKYGQVKLWDGVNTMGVNSDSSITVRVTDLDGRMLKLDAATNSLLTIDYEHHEIHSGSHFFLSNYQTVNNGDTVDFQITTGDTTRWIHLTYGYENTQQLILNVYEGATVTTNGTAVAPVNNNRNSTKVSTISRFQRNGTVTAAGTLLYSYSSGLAGNATTSRSGSNERSNELILKQNTTYRFRFQSLGNGNIFSYSANWYEHISIE